VTRRIALAALIVVPICLAWALPAAAQAAKPPVMNVLLPDPGHVTAAVAAVKVTAGRPKRLVRHVRVGIKRRASLPASVKVLTVQRFIRSKHGGTYVAAVFVVNRAGAAAADAHARTADEPTFLDLLFGSPSSCSRCGAIGNPDYFDHGMCVDCQLKSLQSAAAQAKNVDLLPTPPKLLVDLFRRDLTDGGDSNSVFGDPSKGKPPDPNLDTGHYDDGHAFGWNVKTKSEVIQVEHHVVDDIIEGQPQNIVPHLEVASATDLNGNGQIDQPGSGQQVTTIIGPPVIT
jgi:hypothetical protein